MACTYIYRGHKFNSELELDSFLLEKLKYISKYGDIVFDSLEIRLQQANLLDEINNNPEANRWVLEKGIAKRNNTIVVNEDGEIDINRPPYIGVNRFIAEEKDGDRMVPEFISDNYFIDNRYPDWRQGVYNDAEKEIWDENKGPITDENVLKLMRQEIETRWKALGGIGELVHNINLLYFTKVIDDVDNLEKYVFELANPKKYIFDNIDEENKKWFSNDPRLAEMAFDSVYANVIKLHERIKNEFAGLKLMFFPELLITSDEINYNNKTRRLLGFIDLVILDEEGNVHILDYKTSTKHFAQFGSEKQVGYRYLLAFYRRMLAAKGIRVGKLFISGIKLNNFRLEGDTYTFDGIESIEPLSEIQVSQNSWNKIDNFLPPSYPKLNITTNDALTQVSDIMHEWLPHYSSQRKPKLEDTIKFLKERNLLIKNENGEFIFKPYDSPDAPIVRTEETDFVQAVHNYFELQIPRRLELTKDVKRLLKDGIRLGPNNVNWVTQRSPGQTTSWFLDNMYKYCNNSWEVLDNDVLEQFGIIMIRNKYTPQVDFIRISTRMLTYHPNNTATDHNKGRLGLLSNFENDVVEQSNSNSLMLEGAQGNWELMETMAAINCIDGLENSKIGSIAVYNPYHASKVSATNEELLYCFNALSRHKSMKIDRINNEQIKFMPRFEQVAYQLRDIMAKAEEHKFEDVWTVYKHFKGCSDLLSRHIGENAAVEEQINALNEVLQILRSNTAISQKLNLIYTKSNELADDTISLYNTILTTIAHLKGIKLRQQLSDHSKWCEKAMILRHGWSGTYLDNPGNLNSQTLNTITTMVTEAYQNTRDEMQRCKNEIREAVDKYKTAKHTSALALNLGLNLVSSLYSNLIEEKDTGRGFDLMFKDINTIQDPAEKEFLKFVLKKINKRRFGDSEEVMERKIREYDTGYYRVPLAMGGLDSKISSKGLVLMFKDKLRLLWHPKEAFEEAQRKVEGVFEGSTDNRRLREQSSTYNIFQMSNMFDKGNESTDKRLDMIRNIGIHKFERNLEMLLMKHDFAYIQLKNLDKVFPLIKAATIHLAQQGADLNTEYKKDLSYATDYIKNKIRNESIVNPDFEGAVLIANGVKRAASLLTLAFAPVQMFYQPLQGLWQDISLMIRKPDGKQSFTFAHFKNAFKLVAKDFVHYSDKPTLCSLLNELYAINDMDMNVYAERISKAKKGIWNFENLMMKFASRPDYYNRMAIFLSLMQGDGCLEAHSLENGILKYDWTKDKRFEKFAKNPTSNSTDPEFLKQKQLYYIIAKLFEREHAMVEINGEMVEFKYDPQNLMPLPRAYTNKLAEGMKSLADDIYGYYSHEKKSLIMSTGLGSLWLQFKTYWSGKKNQYLQSGGVRMRGDWVLKKEIIKDSEGNKIDEKLLYYQVDKNGEIRYDKPLTTEPTIAPVMQWQGQWQEGVLVTLSDIAYNSIKDPRHFIQHIKDKWNNDDPNLQTTYRSNMKLFIYDLTMFFFLGSILGALLGDWLDELKDDNKDNTDFMTGVKLAGANVMVSSVKNSFLDLNFIDSIGSPIGSWTPFAFEWTGRQLANLSKVATGDEDIWDGALKIASANKQIKPIFDSIKPEQFRTKREGGTWESATVRRNREKREGN